MFLRARNTVKQRLQRASLDFVLARIGSISESRNVPSTSLRKKDLIRPLDLWEHQSDVDSKVSQCKKDTASQYESGASCDSFECSTDW